MIIVMIGLPGSGKSFHAKRLAEEHLKTPYSQAAIVSADDYFVSEDGVYRHDATLIGAAHNACFRKFLGFASTFKADKDLIVVDNTNLSNWQRSPYMMLGMALGHQTKLVHVQCAVQTCIQRNTHGVPTEALEKMFNYLEMPLPWWTYEILENF
jgi:tRNA uridine 5-carbamoylmethylation protein Kti12